MAHVRFALPKQFRLLVALTIALVTGFVITAQFANPLLASDSAVDTSVFVKEGSSDNGKPLDSVIPFAALLVIALVCAVSCSLRRALREQPPSIRISFVNAPPRAPPLFL